MNLAKTACSIIGILVYFVNTEATGQTMSDLEPFLKKLESEPVDSVSSEHGIETTWYTIENQPVYVKNTGYWGYPESGIKLTLPSGTTPALKNFLNRLALSSLLLDHSQMISYLESENVVIVSVQELNKPFLHPVSIKEEGKFWLVQFKSGYSAKIPKSVSLLSGLQKEQLDNYLSHLLRTEFPVTNPLEIPDNQVPSPIPGFSRTTYLSDAQFIWDSNQLQQSVMNLFFALPVNGLQLVFKTVHQSYGRTKADYQVPFSGLYHTLVKDKDAWIGMEETGRDSIRVTILSFDREFDHAHLFVFETGKQILSEGRRTVTGQLYSYIRQQNVLNWLTDEKAKKSSVRFEVNR